MESHTNQDSGLENRLRGLILANSDDGNKDLLPSGVVHGNVQSAENSHGYRHASASRGGSDGPHKATKRRPNQAERRQMAAELSIPVDPRPQPLDTARQHANYPRHGGQHYGPANRGGGRREYGHQSTDSQPPYRGPAMQNRPLAHQQHRQSLSQDGPRSPDGVENWRQGPRQHTQSLRGQGRLYTPRLYQPGEEQLNAQAAMLEKLSVSILANAEISIDDLMENENFRIRLEQICRAVVTEHEFTVNRIQIPPHTVELKCFGSLASGFATKASDMDLALLSPYSAIQPDAPGSPIPRLLEKAFLEMGIGARLLTRTRVPIIKVCERPPEKLRADLIAARLKWEAGESEAVDGPDEELPDEPTITAAHEEHHDDFPALPGAERQGGDDERADFAAKLATLKQSSHSLSTYYGMAKTILRKVGCFDITQSNAATYLPENRVKLGDVCHAFVSGLADSELKKRLFGYYSLSSMHGHYRTLAGVLLQVEGEKLAMGWMHRPLPEKDEHQEHLAQQALAAWVQIQNKEDFHIDAIAYQKQLQMGLERLRRIPSLQIIDFQQSEFESAAAYHLRAIELMIELGGVDDPVPTNRVLPVIISRYVAGIYNPDIRSGVKAFATARGAQTLRAIARRHKSLQLAHDFQKALGKGYYQDSDAEIVRFYVACLRNPMKPHKDAYKHFDCVVPKTKYVAEEILPAILRLSNPANLAMNQPRDPYQDRLEFPKTGAGVQCDVNFSAHLALHNTALLRCYSYTDPRVKPLILFVKHWAKVRGINNPYRGTLSSYGYVLMVLHYLVNVVQPFVCPNLQLLAPPDDPNMPPEYTVCKGYNVRFWRDEATIKRLASENQLNQNRDSLGYLLRGFFEYYAYNGTMSSYPGIRGFDWGRDTLSLRTPRGILSKLEKGWTGAKTVTEVKTVAAPPVVAPEGKTLPVTKELPTTQEVKEVRHRYLFALEDPFELDHNVARTVTHNGIVAIRDEFRRAWRIIKDVGRAEAQEDLLEDVAKAEEEKNRKSFEQLLWEIHGDEVFDDTSV
ncbi:hypothetical protein BR93DRAFT_942613 [Coniochaeta sp. PMI_546]|nr:hypothetical protein BR93DRAFT_942613 [Coniochaeta sp. PMI_546]